MKPKVYIIPSPRGNCWEKIIKKYKIPAIKEHDGILQKVTFPPGWFIKKDDEVDDFYNIFDEDCVIVGGCFLNKHFGFTIINYPKNLML